MRRKPNLRNFFEIDGESLSLVSIFPAARHFNGKSGAPSYEFPMDASAPIVGWPIASEDHSMPEPLAMP